MKKTSTRGGRIQGGKLGSGTTAYAINRRILRRAYDPKNCVTVTDGSGLPHYTSQGILYTLLIHVSAKQDLESIGQDDPDTRDELFALLHEIKGSQDLLDALTIKDFGLAQDEKFHVDRWVSQQRQGRNLWRLKSWDLAELGIHYRVIYALDPRIRRYYVLAVLPRKFDYDEQHPRVQQLLAVYDRLGIPPYH